MQAPSWTEYLCCMICRRDYDHARPPVSLSCGHSVCRPCLELLQRLQCPFDNASIQAEMEVLPVNFAMLQLVGRSSPELISRGPTEQRNEDVLADPLTKAIEEAKRREAEKIHAFLGPDDYEQYEQIRGCVERLATLLHSPTGGTASNTSLSRPMYRKLVSFVQSQPLEAEGRARTMRAARSVGERVCTELLLLQQNQHSVVHDLWAALRQRGCQFLGHVLQEMTLKLVVLALAPGHSLQRKVLVSYVVQRLVEEKFPSISKTNVGHVIQLLYRASCFNISKKTEGEVSQLALKEELRTYEALRREHDTQVVQIAMEAGLRITPEYYAQILYGDNNKRSHMQSIIDKLTTPECFKQSVEELVITSQKSGLSEADQMANLRQYFTLLATINPSPDIKDYSMRQTAEAVDAVVEVTFPLVNHPKYKSWVEQVKKLPGLGKAKQKASTRGNVVTLHQGNSSSPVPNATGESSVRSYDRHVVASPSADAGMSEFLTRHSSEASAARHYEPVVDVAGHDMSDLVGRCPRSSTTSSYNREAGSHPPVYNHMNTGVPQQGMTYAHTRSASIYPMAMEPPAMPQHSTCGGMAIDHHASRSGAAHPHYTPIQGEPYRMRVGYPSAAEHTQPSSASGQAFSHTVPTDCPPSAYRPPVAHSREVDYHGSTIRLHPQRHEYAMQYNARSTHQYPVQSAQPAHSHTAQAASGMVRRDYPVPSYPPGASADVRAAIQAADAQLPYGFRLLNLED